MRDGVNPNRVAQAEANRAEWEVTFRNLYEAGNNVTDIYRITGKSRHFVRRVLVECGAMAIETEPQVEAQQEPVKQPDQSLTIIEVKDNSHVNRISLPSFPWGEFDRDPRHETAPRGRTYMIASPVTRAEQMARELWREVGV